MLTQLLQRGPVLLVVDQPAGIGALPLAVARGLGVDVAYLPGLAMRRLADLHPGQSKTDARDAHVIADAARTLPHTLRRASVSDATLAELTVLLGYYDDLANETTRLINRARDLMMNISPALERALGPRIAHPAVRVLITQFPTPELLRAADPDHVAALLRANAPRIHTTIHTEVTQALAAQTVVIPGTTAAGRVLTSIIRQLDATLTERTQLLAELEDGLDAHPLGKVLTSMPGVGVRTALKLLTIIGDGAAFPTAGHLAAYAGLAPVTRRSGTSIRGEAPHDAETEP